MTPNLVLVGFMGTGKSTVGKRCAVRLGVPFVDSDAAIEERLGGTVADFFATHGEDAFRQIERETIADLALAAGRVVATGGGVVLNPENVAKLRAGGVVFLLVASPDVIVRRVGDARSRPLLQGAQDPRARVLELWRARRSFYENAAHYRVETTHRRPDKVTDEIITLYRQHLERTAPDRIGDLGRQPIAPEEEMTA